MKKLDYLLFAVAQKLHQERRWWTTAFATVREGSDDWKTDPYEGRIVAQPWGYGFIQNNEIVKIEDAKAGEPLFTMYDPLTVTNAIIVNGPKEPMETNVGSFLSNQLLLADNYGPKIPFIQYRIEIEKVEKFIIENRAVDYPGKERDPTKIYLDEYIKMGQAVEFIRTLGWLSTYSLTETNMTAPDGIEAKQKELQAKYGDLNDPVNLAQYEKELIEFADGYRKDDPTEGKLVKGKLRNNVNRKLFLSSGAEGGMGTPMVAIVESLAQGITYTPETLQAAINGSRSGSYFRGLDTVKGGVSFKLAVRVLGSFFVKDGDCGAVLGLVVTYDKSNISQLVTRRIVGEKAIIENIEEANNYLGKQLTLRTPGFCLFKSSVVCSTCAGPRLMHFPEGMGIVASDTTGKILAASMAAMHKNTIEVTTFDLDTASS